MTDVPMLPLLVGVTGHRDICPSALPAIRGRVREILENLISLYGLSQLHVLIGMAEGADLEVAEIAADLGLARVQLFPTTIEQHQKTLSPSALERYATLQEHHPALLEIVLPPPSPQNWTARTQTSSSTNNKPFSLLVRAIFCWLCGMG